MKSKPWRAIAGLNLNLWEWEEAVLSPCETWWENNVVRMQPSCNWETELMVTAGCGADDTASLLYAQAISLDMVN